MSKVFFSPAGERDTRRLPKKAQDTLRVEHLPMLAANPRSGKMLHGPLRGYFSYDFWSEAVSYRIAYEFTRNDIVILMIDTRDNFYKKLSRRV